MSLVSPLSSNGWTIPLNIVYGGLYVRRLESTYTYDGHFLAYVILQLSSMMVFLAQLAEGGVCTPSPFYSIYGTP
jgi:hypothetical protein